MKRDWVKTVVIVLLAAGSAACVSLEMTPAQKLGFERWEQCKNAAPNVSLTRVEEDGTVRFRFFGTGSTVVHACLAQAMQRQGLVPTWQCTHC